MPAVVADASPLIALARIGQFRLLELLFSPLFIPPAVYRDVVVRGKGRPGGPEVEAGLQAGWIQQQAPLQVLARPWSALHDGEVEAVSLALERQLDVLMDEGPGRRWALQAALFAIGTVDVLLLAKKLGHVTSVRPHLDALQQAHFYLHPTLYADALKKAGEPP
jgi:predicted nucleic acid-binding protein